MNQQNQKKQAVGERASHDVCLCREVLDRLHEVFEVPPATRQHLANSRIEFLKAIRGVIDQRIERLSNPPQRGAKIAVE